MALSWSRAKVVFNKIPLILALIVTPRVIKSKQHWFGAVRTLDLQVTEFSLLKLALNDIHIPCPVLGLAREDIFLKLSYGFLVGQFYV